MHGAHLLAEGKKMSKSLGNFFTVRDLLNQGFTGREIRYSLIQAHYRESFNFTMDGLRGARTALARLDECLAKLRAAAGGASASAEDGLVAQFSAALDEDFNISGAWGAVFDWVRENNRLLGSGEATAARAAAALAAWEKIDSVLALGRVDAAQVPAELQALLEQREAARKASDFKRADAMRDELRAKGWAIEDTPKGARLKEL
jgi:cysteinyl-tRNA synthetase